MRTIDCNDVYSVTFEIEYIIQEIKEYFIKNGPNSKAVLGISGGKDSTITAALLVRALGADNVIGVLMPEGEQKDISDSRRVCEVLDIKGYEINIQDSVQGIYEAFLKEGLEKNDQITSNTPARIRMTALYMVASAVGGRVINTCNFSEDYVGYSTKYGDLAGDFSVLKEYTVREVLAIGDALKELPRDLVHKTPSDGMCGKSDEDNLGFTYKELDGYLMDGIIPSYEVYKEICLRHDRNKHKQCVDIPCVRKDSRYARRRYALSED